jgi:FixJ family two-component response regulator
VIARERSQEWTESAFIQSRIATLTPREHEVMLQMIRGALNKQIAATLGAAEKTIKVHRSRVMRKLQVQSIADLVRLCERVGIRVP